MATFARTELDSKAIDQLCINTIRTLSMDAVEKANSGHPGTAMAMAPVVYTLWQDFLRFDPDDPKVTSALDKVQRELVSANELP